MTKSAFIDAVTDGQAAPPAYFSFDAERNRERHALLDETAVPPALTLAEVVRLQRSGSVVLDTRDQHEFAVGHLAGSINVGLEGRYAEYAGGVVQPGAPIVLITDDGMEVEAKNRLARIGFDRVVGYLAEPLRVFEEHPEEVERSSRIDVGELEQRLATDDDVQLIDVRQPGETATGTIDGAIEIPLTRLNERLASLDASRPTFVYCASGYRSSIAASRMAAAGFTDVSDLLGGYGAWAASRLEPAVTPLISPAELHRRLQFVPPLIVLDVRWSLGASDPRAEHVARRIPDSVYVDLTTELAGPGDPGEGRHPLPDPRALATSAARWGVGAAVPRRRVRRQRRDERGAAVVAAAMDRPSCRAGPRRWAGRMGGRRRCRRLR